MFNIFKKNKKQLPDWSPFESLKTHEKFESAVSSYFQLKNIEHSISNGVVKIPNIDFGLSELGLQNIAQFCYNEGEAKFKDHIAGHFETLIKGYEFTQEFDKLKENYNKVKEYLGIRLYNFDYIKQIGEEKTVGQHLGGDLYAMLIYDLPDTVMSVPPKETESWTISKDDLWSQSLNNTLKKYPPNIMTRELQGITFKTVEEDHFYSPNIVYNLNAFTELQGSYGSLVSMPTRHIVIIYPINDLNVVNALNTQITVTYNVSAKGPGTISNNIFWYREEMLINQPYRIEDGKLAFTPTDEFVNMLNKMKE